MSISLTAPNLSHWNMRSDELGILWLALDKADSSTNVLSQSVLKELELCLDYIEAKNPRGLVIYSAKTNGFIAGADVSEFTQLKSEEQALQFIRYAQGLFDRIERLACGSVALIDGFCLGGGMELALACRYRIACDDDRTRLGLPEVRLGIHPGFGGSVRSLRLLGPLPALDLMLTGKSLSARAAAKIGLVDYAVPRRHLFTAASAVVLKKNSVRKPSGWQRLLNMQPFKSLVGFVLRNQLAKKVNRNHYPAPYAILNLWQDFDHDQDVMLNQEARSIAGLIRNETTQNLVRIFFLQEKLKNLGRNSPFKAKHVHVIGAGVMGGDIAAWCASKGLKVTLQDQSPERISPAIKRAYELFKKTLKQPRLIQKAMDNLIPDVKGLGVKGADVVIEAIFENREAKQSLYKRIEPLMKPNALLTTNTSSIPLEELCGVLTQPSRLVGLHFFNPVSKMQLIEIVSSATTDPQVSSAAAAFARQIDRLPLPVKSTPGFLVNRILMPYLLEAVEMLAEGTPAEVIDAVALDFGMPMGPVELSDTVGLDICLSVAEILSQHLGAKVPSLLRDKVAAKELGRKTKKGFYTYTKGKVVKQKIDVDQQTAKRLSERLISRLLNEAMTCLREQVVENSDLLDAGIVFGTGFAPFRGGPMHFAEKSGSDKQKALFVELEQTFGERFHPDAGWDNVKKAS